MWGWDREIHPSWLPFVITWQALWCQMVNLEMNYLSHPHTHDIALYTWAETFISGEYDQNICSPGNSSCVPCKERLPSCIGKPDGAHAFTGLEWTDNYITCFKNRTVGIDKCPTASYFDPRNNGCVSKLNVGKCRRLNMVIYVTLDEIIDYTR